MQGVHYLKDGGLVNIENFADLCDAQIILDAEQIQHLECIIQ
jgi:uncharacterized protein YacL